MPQHDPLARLRAWFRANRPETPWGHPGERSGTATDPAVAEFNERVLSELIAPNWGVLESGEGSLIPESIREGIAELGEAAGTGLRDALIAIGHDPRAVAEAGERARAVGNFAMNNPWLADIAGPTGAMGALFTRGPLGRGMARMAGLDPAQGAHAGGRALGEAGPVAAREATEAGAGGAGRTAARESGAGRAGRQAAQEGDLIIQRYMPRRTDVVRAGDPGVRTQVRGREDARRELAPGLFPDRTNWYELGQTPEALVTGSPRASEIATARIPRDRVLSNDHPQFEELVARGRELANEHGIVGGPAITSGTEQAAREAGFAAYQARPGTSVVMFEDVRPQHWRRAGEPPPSPDQITGNALDLSAAPAPSLAQSVREATEASGGATFDPRTGRNLFGDDVVSVAANPGDDMVVPLGRTKRGPTADELAEFRREFADQLAEDNIGTWIRELENGEFELVFDVARTFPDTPAGMDQARRLAVENGQDGIFRLGRDVPDAERYVPTPVTDPSAPAREAGAQGVSRPVSTGQALDLSNLGEGIGMGTTGQAGVPQTPLERVMPVRGTSPQVQELFRAQNMNRMLGIMDDGIAQGGHVWYDTSPLRRVFIEELGEELGSLRFAQFMDMQAATSPRAAVAGNIRRGSLFDNYMEQGIPLPRTNADLPPGYGHMAHTTAHRPMLEDIFAGRGIASGDSPARMKAASFSQNLQGNLLPLTADAHFYRIATGDPTITQVPRLHYEGLERLGAEVAAGRGLTPAAGQSALWVGGSNLTGVRDARPWISMMDQRIRLTADKTGKSVSQVIRDLARGEAPLWGMGGLFGAEMMRGRAQGGLFADEEMN